MIAVRGPGRPHLSDNLKKGGGSLGTITKFFNKVDSEHHDTGKPQLDETADSNSVDHRDHACPSRPTGMTHGPTVQRHLQDPVANVSADSHHEMAVVHAVNQRIQLGAQTAAANTDTLQSGPVLVAAAPGPLSVPGCLEAIASARENRWEAPSHTGTTDGIPDNFDKMMGHQSISNVPNLGLNSQIDYSSQSDYSIPCAQQNIVSQSYYYSTASQLDTSISCAQCSPLSQTDVDKMTLQVQQDLPITSSSTSTLKPSTSVINNSQHEPNQNGSAVEQMEAEVTEPLPSTLDNLCGLLGSTPLCTHSDTYLIRAQEGHPSRPPTKRSKKSSDPDIENHSSSDILIPSSRPSNRNVNLQERDAGLVVTVTNDRHVSFQVPDAGAVQTESSDDAKKKAKNITMADLKKRVPTEAWAMFKVTRTILQNESKANIRSAHNRYLLEHKIHSRWSMGLCKAPAYYSNDFTSVAAFVSQVKESSESRTRLLAETWRLRVSSAAS